MHTIPDDVTIRSLPASSLGSPLRKSGNAGSQRAKECRHEGGIRCGKDGKVSKEYFFKQLLEGCFYSAIVVFVWSTEDYHWGEHLEFALLIFISTFMYPMSKFSTQGLAYSIFKPLTWRKILGLQFDSMHGVQVLFALFCLVLAIPIGSSYCIFRLFKRG
jgi:hypothetical protein